MGESRDDIIRRIEAEQAAINPVPAYDARRRRRVWWFGAAMLPVTVALAALIGIPLGWPPLLWVATGVGATLGTFYLVYVFMAERDDGMIQRAIQDAIADTPAQDE